MTHPYLTDWRESHLTEWRDTDMAARITLEAPELRHVSDQAERAIEREAERALDLQIKHQNLLGALV